MSAGWWVAVALVGALALVLLVNHYRVAVRRLRQVPPSDCRSYGATSRRPVFHVVIIVNRTPAMNSVTQPP